MKRFRLAAFVFTFLLALFAIPLIRDRASPGPLLQMREAQADNAVRSIFNTVTDDGVSNWLHVRDGLPAGIPCGTLAIQVTYTGSPTITLESTIDGTMVQAAVQTWSASGQIKVTTSCGGPIAYRLRVASCGGTCTITGAKAVVNGNAAIDVTETGITPTFTPTRTFTATSTFTPTATRTSTPTP